MENTNKPKMPTVKDTVEAMRTFIVAQNTVLNYLCEELAGKSIDEIFHIAMDKNQKKEDELQEQKK